jgi:PHD/YefM family antitoxin component YafN of YafNO toxin-antitoxin module
MAFTIEMLNSLIPITQFNKGQASRIFDRLRTERQLIVLKNNSPSAVILSPEEYARLSEIEEDYMLLTESTERLTNSSDKPSISFDTVLTNLGISEQDLDDVEDIVIE